MKILLKRAGLALIFLGILLLAAFHVLPLPAANAPLLFALCLIAAGIALHVWTSKRDSRY